MFGDIIVLRGAAIEPQEGHEDAAGDLTVTLWWEAMAVPDEDYTVFVHLIGEEGQLVATGDRPPLRGGFPTSMWQPSDWVVDGHTITLPPDAPSGVVTVRVGWYNPVTGARLVVRKGGEESPDDSVIVGAWLVP